ncbi:MAG: formate dehydrogenase accessory sulfurtransferase FdhD [Chloroflexota bacterium]|nr:formate dehydrogenase accessory sulfurtransferase FdhD [Chloroflexota bacterium]MDE2908881.1 formate dehydrogenase accessory sulfurtransferase FdhD [Chloroflexota bacterium]
MATKAREKLDGALPFTYQVVEGDQIRQIEGGVIDEQLLSIYVNGESLATMMCSPVQLEALTVGFLYNEAVIDSAVEIALLQLNRTNAVADVMLTRGEVKLPRRMILTTGCGGGVTGQELSKDFPALDSAFQSEPARILRLMRQLQGAARLYNAVRGVHTAALGGEGGLLLSGEDVGRHNAVDKVAGQALLDGIDTRDRILLTSGRISSEMLGKARRMGIPLVASRTAPTSVTLELAQAWNICVVGYARSGGMRVYTHGWRLGLAKRDLSGQENSPPDKKSAKKSFNC